MSELIESKDLSMKEIQERIEKQSAKQAVTVYIENESSAVVLFRKDGAAISERKYKSENDNKYRKYAVPVVHENDNKVLELFWNEMVEFLKVAEANPEGRVTVARNKDGKHSFT